MRTLLIPVVMALVGCATAPRPFLAPLAPETLGQSVEARQQVTATWRGRTRSMQVALKVAPKDLTLIGLSSIGQRLFTLTWNGRKADLVSVLGSGVDDPDGLDPARILADLELTYWPLPALRRALNGSLRLEQQGTVRTLWDDNTLLWFASSATDDRWASAMTIYNARIGYRLDIRPLAVDAISP